MVGKLYGSWVKRCQNTAKSVLAIFLANIARTGKNWNKICLQPTPYYKDKGGRLLLTSATRPLSCQKLYVLYVTSVKPISTPRSNSIALSSKALSIRLVLRWISLRLFTSALIFSLSVIPILLSIYIKSNYITYSKTYHTR